MKTLLWTLPLLMLGACATEQKLPDDDDFSDLADAKADAFSSKMKIVDSLSYGSSAADVHYTKTPTYRAYTFSAEVGNSVDIWVRSSNGDPVAWVLDSKFKTLGKNDDATSNNTDSHIELTIPETKTTDASTTPNVYYVVFRNSTSASADFAVTLDGGPGYDESCNVNADCVQVADGGCCPHGRRDVVNTDSTTAWADLTVCTENPHPICPLYVVYDDRVARCDHSTHLCTLAEPN